MGLQLKYRGKTQVSKEASNIWGQRKKQ